MTGEYHAKVTVKDGILLVKFIGTIQNQFENLNYQKQTLQNKKKVTYLKFDGVCRNLSNGVLAFGASFQSQLHILESIFSAC